MRIAWNKGKIEWKKCLGCNVLVRKWRKYCSKKCQVGHLSPPVILEKNCVLCKKIFQVRLSQKTRICCSDICGKKIAGKTRSGVNHPMHGKHHTVEARKKISIGHIGILAKEKNPNWKGGKQTQNHMDRVRFRKTIQKQVLERDNYTCQLCGQIGGDLQVDHIQSWAEYIKMRFCIDNCRTLCVPCHYKITYGKPMPPSVRAWGHNFLKGGN